MRAGCNATKYGASATPRRRTSRGRRRPRAGAGDVWTWTAIDSDSKMILSYEVGDRSGETAIEFMDDLRARLANRVQLTTDGLKAVSGSRRGRVRRRYRLRHAREALRLSGRWQERGAALLAGGHAPASSSGRSKATPTRPLSALPMSSGRTSPCGWGCAGLRGSPTVSARRSRTTFTMLRSTSATTISLRIHKTLKVTPAMAAGVDSRLRDTEWIVSLIDARAPKPNRPKTYSKNQVSN